MPHINSVYDSEDDEAIFKIFGAVSEPEYDSMNEDIYAIFGAGRDRNGNSILTGRV